MAMVGTLPPHRALLRGYDTAPPGVRTTGVGTLEGAGGGRSYIRRGMYRDRKAIPRVINPPTTNTKGNGSSKSTRASTPGTTSAPTWRNVMKTLVMAARPQLRTAR